MARLLKPYKVDDVRSPNGYTTADVMFDRDRKVFFVEVIPGDADSRVEGDLLLDVKKKAVIALAASQKYDWTPLIEVSVSEAWYNNIGNGEGASIRFEFRRFERSVNPIYPDRFVERPHVLDLPSDQGPRLKQRNEHRDISPYSGPDNIGPAKTDGGDALLPYRQDVWDGLVAIHQSIDAARQKLDALLQRKDAATLLMRAGGSSTARTLRGIALLAQGDE